MLVILKINNMLMVVIFKYLQLMRSFDITILV